MFFLNLVCKFLIISRCKMCCWLLTKKPTLMLYLVYLSSTFLLFRTIWILIKLKLLGNLDSGIPWKSNCVLFLIQNQILTPDDMTGTANLVSFYWWRKRITGVNFKTLSVWVWVFTIKMSLLYGDEHLCFFVIWSFLFCSVLSEVKLTFWCMFSHLPFNEA